VRQPVHFAIDRTSACSQALADSVGVAEYVSDTRLRLEMDLWAIHCPVPACPASAPSPP
jgi:hypothetical protein